MVLCVTEFTLLSLGLLHKQGKQLKMECKMLCERCACCDGVVRYGACSSLPWATAKRKGEAFAKEGQQTKMITPDQNLATAQKGKGAA
eukprot:1156804-Pelagomonas_calceolata.AAC.7